MFLKTHLQYLKSLWDSIIKFFVFMAFIQLLFSCAHDKCKNFYILKESRENEYSIENYQKLKRKYNKRDNDLKLYKPLIFAHRGGALEAPESTLRAFTYAKDVAGADILELDVHLTKDGKFVVWHGPDLDNVYINKSETCPNDGPTNTK